MDSVEELAIQIFHERDIRGGLGDRKLFRETMKVIYEREPSLAMALLGLIPIYGYWKDLFYLSDAIPDLRLHVMNLCKEQLEYDEYMMTLGHKPSLMAKYIPKEGAKTSFANNFARHLYPHVEMHSSRMKKMRLRISALNKDTVEVKMCANQWDTIEPWAVPAKARQRYISAFLNENKPNSDSPQRQECRKKFLAYLINHQPQDRTPDPDRYRMVRVAVDAWRFSRLNTANVV